jgi:hypothetical protein
LQEIADAPPFICSADGIAENNRADKQAKGRAPHSRAQTSHAGLRETD